MVCCLPQGKAGLGVGAGRLVPSRRTGLTSVASTASRTPPKTGTPFAATSRRRPLDNGMPRLRSRKKNVRRYPHASLATNPGDFALSTPAVGQASSGSRAPPQRHARGSRRRRRSRTHRNKPENSSRVGSAAAATLPPSLRQQQGPRRWIEFGKERLEGLPVQVGASGLLPPRAVSPKYRGGWQRVRPPAPRTAQRTQLSATPPLRALPRAAMAWRESLLGWPALRASAPGRAGATQAGEAQSQRATDSGRQVGCRTGNTSAQEPQNAVRARGAALRKPRPPTWKGICGTRAAVSSKAEHQGDRTGRA